MSNLKKCLTTFPHNLTHQKHIKLPITSFLPKSTNVGGFQSLHIGGSPLRNAVACSKLSYIGATYLVSPFPGFRRDINGDRFSCFRRNYDTNRTNKRKADNNLEDEHQDHKKSKTTTGSLFPDPIWPEPKPKAPPPAVITEQHVSLSRGLHHHAITSTPLLEFQKNHETRLLTHLKELIVMEQTLEVGLEMAAIVNLLKLFNYSHDSKKQDLVNQASAGAQSLQDGLQNVKEGQDMLREAVVQMLHLHGV